MTFRIEIRLVDNVDNVILQCTIKFQPEEIDEEPERNGDDDDDETSEVGVMQIDVLALRCL